MYSNARMELVYEAAEERSVLEARGRKKGTRPTCCGPVKKS